MLDAGAPNKLLCAALALVMSAATLGAARDARAQDTGVPPAPQPSAVPLQVESNGSRGQHVSIVGFDGGCDTPCVLMVPPGAHTLLSAGRGVRMGREPVLVPPAGLAVQLREPTRAGFVGGVILTGFGAATLALGTVFVVAIAASSASDPYNQMMMGIVGVMTGVLGIPSLVIGLWMLMRHATGIESTRAATVATAWSIVPTVSPGGAGVAWSARF